MSCMRWLLEQSDSILSQHEINKQFLGADYTMLHPAIIGEARLGNFIRRELTRDLDQFAPVIVDEVVYSLDQFFGDETEWKEIRLYDTMLQVVGRLVNRVLVGKELARDAEYMACSTSFNNKVNVTASLIALLPAVLRPLLAPVVTAWDTWQYWRLARIMRPIVSERRERYFSSGSEKLGDREADGEQPNDFVQWALRDAFSKPELFERTDEMITKRLAILGFAGIQSSSITVTNALFDIAASPDCLSIIDELRCEALKTQRRVENAEGKAKGVWTKSALAGMVKTDSVLRESLRLWGFSTHGIVKAVVARGGIVLPSGEKLPYGAKCGVISYGPQRDGSVYGPEPDEFLPFRFCRPAVNGNGEGVPAGNGEEGNGSEKVVGVPFVQTMDWFMGFSHGRHACPGRFFASQQLKLLLAHIVLKYEIQPLAEKPERPWLNNTIGPPIWEILKIRRRRED